jgi:hypothetical protein
MKINFKQKLFFSLHYKENANLTFFQNIKFIFIFFLITVGILYLFFSSIAFAQSPSLSALKENECCVPILLAPMSIDDNGNLLISWADNRTGNWEIFFTKSLDNGKTFKDSINVSNSPNGRSENVEIASEKDNIYITFWDNKTGEIAPYIVVSENEGETFSVPLLLKVSKDITINRNISNETIINKYIE